MSRILVVDEDKVSLAVTSRILQQEGYQVDKARDTEKVRECCAQNDYAVVITETEVAGANGRSVIDIVKKMRPSTKVVVMTGFGTLDSAVACMRDGAVDFLLKPCQRQYLCDAVQKAVAKKELSRENLMLRGLNEMKDKFLTLVSHELRTPLTLIYGYLTILQRQSFSFNEDQVSLVNIIMKSSKQLISIVNNIQTISQAESNEFELHIQSVWPRKLLADVLAETKASCNHRQLHIHLEDGEKLEPFGGDAIRLHQSLAELVQNAVRNTKDGGEISLGAEEQNDKVIMWVRDNGIGIPEEEQGKIFEAFYEVADVKQHTSSNSRFGGGGIGIGLPLVKRVVEAHQGTIHLSSRPGCGTYVVIAIPRKSAPAARNFKDKLE